MPDLVASPIGVQDLPVCFPGRPCVDYSPYEADAINLTMALTPVSQAIAIAGFIAAAVTLALVVFGLRRTPRHPRPGLWLVAAATALLLSGAIVVGTVEVRSSALFAAYGVGGSAGPDFYGSWSLVSVAGGTMAAAGLGALVATALVGMLRLCAIEPGPTPNGVALR